VSCVAPRPASAPPRGVAYAGLAPTAEAALKVDPESLLFSNWTGSEMGQLKVERRLSPAGLVPGRYIFDDVLEGGEGMSPPVLIRLCEGAP